MPPTAVLRELLPPPPPRPDPLADRRRGIESSTRLGRYRWTIERTGAWLGGFRWLRIRYERSSERFHALGLLACSIICFNPLQQPW